MAPRPRADGAGLGLAIESRIVEARAGEIEVCNRATGGAMFSIRLAAGYLPKYIALVLCVFRRMRGFVAASLLMEAKLPSC
jgi:hypothetical protein